MSHNIVTECPACTTRFQVTQGQLKIANGKVRCGSCLEVFNAEVYRCDDLPSPLEEFEQNSKHFTPKKTPEKDPLFDNIEVAAFAPPHPSPMGFDKRYSAEIEELSTERQHSTLLDDDSDELEQPVQKIIKADPTPDLKLASAQTTMELNTDNSTEQPVEPAAKTTTPQQSPTLASDAESISVSSPTKPEKRFEVVPTKSVEKASTRELNVSENNTVKPPQTTSITKAQTRPPLSFTTFQPEPVMIRTTREESSYRTGWTILVLLAILLLTGQYLWFNRQQLSTYPELTAVYKQACLQLPCHLDVPINLNLFNIQKLAIQQQAQYQGVLSVKLILENRADFNQRLPAVELFFSDRRGQLISQRIFQPDEYLKNQTTKVNISAKKKIQINFDILDPGRRALSYEAHLKAPTIDH